jgi:hypothetical protein
MSFPEKWVRERLQTATTAGVYPVMAGQNAPFPLVVYRRTGTKRDRLMSGVPMSPMATFSVSIVAETYSQAKDIAVAVRLACDNFTGISQEVTIVSTALVSEQDNMERPFEGQSKPLYRVDQVYEVRFQESV